MRARHFQNTVALIFLCLGSACLIFPEVVQAFIFHNEYRGDGLSIHLLIRFYGAKSALLGAVLSAARFSPAGFIIFAVGGSIPFVAMDLYFLVIRPVFSAGIAIDITARLAILILGTVGWQLKLKEEQSIRSAKWQDLY
ncbi:MAG: hypothetical protein AAF950_11580 [Pseudomonadota bacterium]